MYQLSLNNEELFELRTLLEKAKVGHFTSYYMTSPTISELLLKVTLAQIDAQEADEREAQADRHARNHWARPNWD